MKRKFISFPVGDINLFKQKLLSWSDQFNIFCFLDNQGYDFTTPQFDFILAAGVEKNIVGNDGDSLRILDDFMKINDDWLFGHLSYDLKNEIEDLNSNLPGSINFPDLHFFIPSIIIKVSEATIEIGSLANDHHEIYSAIINNCIPFHVTGNAIHINQRFQREVYLNAFAKIKEHIHRGDCYEINFCQEFYAEHVTINPLVVFNKLSEISASPFSSFYKFHDQYLLCASPERYIKKDGLRIISQPIKGTAARDLEDKTHDDYLKQELINSKKERSENVMIVDLVRNDLSKFCKPGSVRVEELFGIYSFPQVHQMISTIAGEVESDTSLSQMIRASFPMGSMTGAPKKRVMELIEEYEKTKRGLYSGSIGYISPSGDFDFNVVIRSIQYNAATKYLSFITGSAITFSSDAEQEYEECLLKGKAMMEAVGSE